MAKEQGTLGSIIHGVSQQPLDRRNPGTCESLSNMINDATTGPRRRTGTELQYNFGVDTAGWQQFFFTQNGEQYVMLTTSQVAVIDNVRIFNVSTGIEEVVTVDVDAAPYLNTTPEYESQLPHVATSTTTRGYLLNKHVRPSMTASSVSKRPGIYLNLIATNYGRTLTVEVFDDTGLGVGTGSHTIPVQSSDLSNSEAIDTVVAMNGLYAALSTALGSSITLVIESDVMHLSSGDMSLGHVTVSDGNNGNDLTVCKEVVSDINTLPRLAYNDSIIEVQSNDDPKENYSYYLKFEEDFPADTPEDSFGHEGTWVETVASGVDTIIDPATMPVVFYYSGGQFFVSLETWEDRRVGDAKSNGVPKIMEQKLNDILIFQSRLFFLGDSFVCASRIDKYNDVWKQTATSLTADDRVNLESSFNTADSFQHMVLMDKNLWIMGSTHQFVLPASNGVDATQTYLAPAGNFSVDVSSAPQVRGNDVVYAQFSGEYSAVSNLRTVSSSFKADSTSITDHIPAYIRGRIVQIAVSFQHRVMVILTNSSMYLYDWVSDSQSLAQSAWGEWSIDGNVVDIAFLDDELVLTIQDDDTSRWLYKLQVGHKTSATTGTEVYLDKQVAYAITSEVVLLTDLPYTYTPEVLRVIQSTASHHPGMIIPVEYDTEAGTIIFPTEYVGTTVILGEVYTSRIIPSMPVLRDSNGAKLDYNSYILNNLAVKYSDTGPFYAHPSTPWSPQEPIQIAGRRVGGLFNQLGTIALSTDIVRIPIRSDADHAVLDIYSNSHYPMNITSIEHQGQTNTTGTRRLY